jgi:hypothetical protein
MCQGEVAGLLQRPSSWSGPSNDYTGGTTVDAGTLTVAAKGAIPDGTSLIVGAGGTFVFDPSAGGGPAGAACGEASRGGLAAVPEPGTWRCWAWPASWPRQPPGGGGNGVTLTETGRPTRRRLAGPLVRPSFHFTKMIDWYV